MSDNRGVAPPDLIRQDFKNLDSRDTLRTTWAVEELLLVQSVLGHVHEGHGVFRGRRFPNTTLDDIVRALRLEPMSIKGARQSLIDDIRSYARSAVVGQAPRALVDQTGAPLLGISTLRYIGVEPADVLRGLYLGGMRDNAEVRAEAEKTYGIPIGGGACYHVDFDRMNALGISADELVHGEWGDRIGDLEADGLIVEPRHASRASVAYQYIRHRKGPGASDDAAMVGAGLLWGLGVALGTFLADAVDTLEKYVPRHSDQDGKIAEEIAEEWGDLGVGRTEAVRLAAVAAAPSGGEQPVPDSSLRHLLAVDRHTDLCAVEAHVLAVMGTPAPVIGLGHERIPSSQFYAWVRKRIKETAP
jgi:hypothetical protein